MATTIQGTGGNVALMTGFGAKLASWSAKAEITVVDITGFSDNGYRAKRPTLVKMTGSCSGIADETTTITKSTFFAGTALLTDAKGTITLTAASGCTYAFAGVINGVKLTRPNDGKCDISFDFISNGAITQTWA